MDLVNNRGVADMALRIREAVRLEIRDYFSPHQLWAAQDLSDQVGKIEAATNNEPDQTTTWRHLGLVLASVQSAASFLEAAINEFLKDAAEGHLKMADETTKLRLGDLWEAIEGDGRGTNSSVLRKYELALRIVGKEFDTGTNPYQDAKLLLQLRNGLAHYKPETVAVDDEHEFTKRLKNKFAESKLRPWSPHEPWYPHGCLGHGCCQWAIRSAVALADFFFGQFTVTENPPYKHQFRIPH
jgi:hypothetical protein